MTMKMRMRMRMKTKTERALAGGGDPCSLILAPGGWVGGPATSDQRRLGGRRAPGMDENADADAGGRPMTMTAKTKSTRGWGLQLMA
jgi:hypothetical protein